MKDSKEKDLKLKEKELEVTANAEALEDDAELSAEELDEVSGGYKVNRLVKDLLDSAFSSKN